MRAASKNTPLLGLILILFLGSGALALVYQVVWARLMTHVFGSTAMSVGTVLAAFMGGMAIGSWWIGRLADRRRNHLRLYAVLEIGIAGTAALSHVALTALDAWYPVLHALAGGSALILATSRFLVAFLLVMAPTVLMGATLPVLSRFLVSRQEAVGIGLSTLYAVNTLGAVLGAFLTGFVLIGSFGIHAPVYAAVLGNLLIGLVAWAASRSESMPDAVPPDIVPTTKTTMAEDAGGATLALVIAGLGISGFTSFAYEIYWTRSLVFILGNSTYALTTMLCAFLTGIALGGYLVRFAIRYLSDHVAAFGWIQLTLGVVSALALPFLFAFNEPGALEHSLRRVSADALTLVFSSFGVAFLVMLLPATLIGASFPLVGHIAARRPGETGTIVGRVYAVNTAGNVLGALLPGVALISWLGIQAGILLMAALNVVLGLTILALRLLRTGRSNWWRAALPVLLLSSGFALSGAPLDFEFPSRGELARHQTLYYREGPLATTKVYRDPVNDEKLMSVDGIVIGGTGNTHFKQLLLAHLPRLLVDDTARELSVGLGSAILVGESARYDNVKAITAVEIEPSVIEGAAWFREESGDVLDDPRLTVVVDDVSAYLRTTPAKFDVITADEKTADEFASNGFSYSLDYYRLLRERLAPGGLVAQWVPSTLPPSQYRMILRTFAEGFPHTQLWQFLPSNRVGPFNTILVGSLEPVPIRFDEVARRFEQNREALANLVPYGITSAAALLPHFIADETIIRPAVADAMLNTLDHPHYEFYQPWGYADSPLQKVIRNQAFLLGMKHHAFEGFFAELDAGGPSSASLRQVFTAEFRYLEAFQRFLAGMPPAEIFRTFDDILAMAPDNDSLRARIYLQFRYIALSQRDLVRRRLLLERAEALYEDARP